jgi:hypothetical protein
LDSPPVFFLDDEVKCGSADLHGPGTMLDGEATATHRSLETMQPKYLDPEWMAKPGYNIGWEDATAGQPRNNIYGRGGSAWRNYEKGYDDAARERAALAN